MRRVLLLLAFVTACGLPKPSEFKDIQEAVKKGFEGAKESWSKGFDGAIEVLEHNSRVVATVFRDCFEGGCDPVPVFKGKDGKNGVSGEDGTNAEVCVVSSTEEGATIQCGDDEVSVYHGRDGRDGEDGADGTDGQDGTDGSDGAQGDKGDKGDQGLPGTDGQDGAQGVAGIDGEDGVDGSFDGMIEYVTICPNKQGSHKEVLIKLNGTFLGFLDGGNNDRLVILSENTQYKSTDGRNAKFQIINSEIVCN
jgi:hypothetical protein